MAKLPRSPISEGVTNQYRPVREARASGADPVGQAMEQAGNAGFEIASRMADAKIAADAASAEIGLRSDLDKLRRELEADSETAPEQLESVYRERASKIVADRTSGMQSPALRRAFGAQSAASVESGVIDIRDVTRRKQVSSARAEALVLFDNYEKTTTDVLNYTKPADGGPSLAEKDRDTAIGLIERQRQAGIWDEDTAVEQTLKARAVYDLGLSNSHVFAIDAELDKGDAASIARADAYFMKHSGEITQEQREKVRDFIEVKKNEGIAVTVSDELWTQSGENYGEFLKLIREDKRITSPDQLLAAEARGAQRMNQRDAAEKEKYDADLKTGMASVVNGKRPPASWFATASPLAVDRIQTELRQRQEQSLRIASMTPDQKAEAKAVSASNYLDLSAQLGDSELVMAGLDAILADPQLQERYQNMTLEDQNKFRETVEKAQGTGGVPADKTLKAYKDVIALVNVYAPSLGTKRAGFTSIPVTLEEDFLGVGEGTPGDAYINQSRKKTPAAIALEGALFGLVQEELTRTNGAPIDQERAQQLTALAFAQAGEDPKTGQTRYPISEDVAAGDLQTKLRTETISFRRDNPDIWSKATARIRSQYPAASEAMILEEAKILQRQVERRAFNESIDYGSGAFTRSGEN
jgi:hypothetical protein